MNWFFLFGNVIIFCSIVEKRDKTFCVKFYYQKILKYIPVESRMEMNFYRVWHLTIWVSFIFSEVLVEVFTGRKIRPKILLHHLAVSQKLFVCCQFQLYFIQLILYWHLSHYRFETTIKIKLDLGENTEVSWHFKETANFSEYLFLKILLYLVSPWLGHTLKTN